jgi:hypothetical protein
MVQIPPAIVDGFLSAIGLNPKDAEKRQRLHARAMRRLVIYIDGCVAEVAQTGSLSQLTAREVATYLSGISHVFGEEAFAKELTKVAGEFLSLADASPSQYQAKSFGVLSDDLQKLNASLKGIASFMDAIAGPQP